MRIVGSVALALSMVACTSGPTLVGGESVKVMEASALPAPTRADVAAPTRPYLIGPFDRVTVEVFGVNELTRTAQVDSGGRISLPLVGDLEAAGKTPSELARAIEERLRGQYVRNPSVNVNLEETVSQVITVDGEVRTPGLYPVLGRMTLMRAIARAQGLTEFARQNHVVIFRTSNDQRLAALYDLRAIRQGIYEDPEVYAEDVVVVGEAQARRLFHQVMQAAGVLTAPIVTALQ